MIKSSEVVRKIVRHTPFFLFGISNRLLNLTQLAKFIQPLVETRVKKEVQISSIVMSLSRLQREMNLVMPKVEDHRIDHLNIYSRLCNMTFNKNEKTHRQINQVYADIQAQGGYMTITEGIREITIIVEEQFLDKIRHYVKERPKYHNENLAAISVSFNERYVPVPGFIHAIVQQITLQNINIVEISSTYTELILYIKEADARLAFDTLFSRFSTN